MKTQSRGENRWQMEEVNREKERGHITISIHNGLLCHLLYALISMDYACDCSSPKERVFLLEGYEWMTSLNELFIIATISEALTSALMFRREESLWTGFNCDVLSLTLSKIWNTHRHTYTHTCADSMNHSGIGRAACFLPFSPIRRTASSYARSPCFSGPLYMYVLELRSRKPYFL